MTTENPTISIILPCLNEEQALPSCLESIKNIISTHQLNAEIIVIDNGSSDQSKKIAQQYNACVIEESLQGYGSAYLAGLQIAKGKYLFLADADGSYDFKEIPAFLSGLEEGYDFVIGNRFGGNIEKNAMPWMHRYIGNPILSWTLRLFFQSTVPDAHCGMRAITKEALHKLNLKTLGMEFASEMIVKAEKEKLNIKTLPINYHQRKGKSKLKSFADGWRHLRFMLLYSPLFLFFLPGLFLLLLGSVLFFFNYLDVLTIGNIRFDYHPLFLFSLFIITGYQLVIFSLFSKTYAITHLGDKPIFDPMYKHITIEKAGSAGIFLALIGAVIFLIIFKQWTSSNFGELQEIKNAILGLTLISLGVQTIFSSFMLSILGIKEK